MGRLFPGWHYYQCPHCDTHWRESVKNYSRPQLSSCPNDQCGYVGDKCNTPYQSVKDTSLKVSRNQELVNGSELEILS